MNRAYKRKLALLVIAIFTMGLSASFAQQDPPLQPQQEGWRWQQQDNQNPPPPERHRHHHPVPPPYYQNWQPGDNSN